DDYTDEATVSALADKQILREGVILNDSSVIDAVSHSHNKHILLGATVKDGILSESESIVSAQELDQIFADIEQTIKDIGAQIFAGRASADPNQQGKNDPCKFCDMLPVCRKMNF
ncbi:MAG: PD-(D/E)XK nuclease family protein, partial [Clostridia bacterium]|nr:PD-(D/E)XK nuclease family protein [Clostridia bacterium]